jgi:hypothetical protein
MAEVYANKGWFSAHPREKRAWTGPILDHTSQTHAKVG